MKGSLYGIAVEAWPLVLAALGAAAWLATGPLPALALVPGMVLLYALLNFRDPEREIPSDPLGVLSPVDGSVIDVDTGPAGARVLLRVATFSAYVLRSPVEGKVLESGPENGGHGLRIRTDEGEEIAMRLAGPRWLPSAASIGYGERIGQGQRCGLLRGARVVEIRLPPGAPLAVREGDKVLAGETVLGRFPSEGAAGT